MSPNGVTHVAGPYIEPGDDSCVRGRSIASSIQASVFAARKSLYVCGGFRVLALLQGEGGGGAERRNLVTAAAYLPDRRETEHTATPLGAPPRRSFGPVRSSGDVAAEA